MNIHSRIAVLCGLTQALLVTSSSVHAQEDPIGRKVDSLLNLMTLEEKVGQLNQYSWDITGPISEETTDQEKFEHLSNGLIGSVLSARGVKQVKMFQKMAVEGSRLGIPVVFGQDIIHGYKTLAPIPLAEAASWDLEAIERSARMAATEASAVGINWTFAPMVDISRDARWGRVMEGAGEDPFLGSAVAAARVRGFQGEDLSAPNTIAATLKHFAGYGWSEAGKDYNTVDFGTNTLYNFVLPPFEAGIKAGSRAVMNGFSLYNGVPVTANAYLQRDLLKGAWGFTGLVVSDWQSIMEMIPHGYAEDLKEAAERGIKAGSDLDMESRAYIRHLVDLVREGRVSEELVDEAAGRVLRLKFELGLFDDPYRYCDRKREKNEVFSEEHREIALDMAKKSIVLLKNSEGILPLDTDQDKLLVIGELAADKTSMLGSWRIGSDDGTAVSVLEGLDGLGVNYRYVPGPKVFGTPNFVQEMEVNTTDRSGIAQAVEAARTADKVIMVLGEHGFQSGEARSRTELDLPGLQPDLLRAVYEVNPNIILVITNGRPLAIEWEAEHIPAIVEAWQLGTGAGTAIASVLFGDTNPSGKLPMTFPRTVGQVPIYYNHYSTGRPTNKNDNVFWAHYIDADTSPLFPFGYGLSYTDFSYSGMKVQPAGPQEFRVEITVSNTGSRTGEEVVQLYITDIAGSIARPVKELKGFEKVELTPGESRTLTFELGSEQLGFYNAEYQWVVEPGKFQVHIGGNSRDVLTGSFVLNP